MSKSSSRRPVEDDDIIELNVGGIKMTTYRSTLCQVDGSLLAATFSSDSLDGTDAKYDKNGCVFLDYNPDHFAVVLNYLRAKASTIKNREDKPENKPAEINPKNLAEDKQSRNAGNKPESFNMFVKYLGLNEMLLPVSESFKGSSCILEEDGAVASDGLAFGQNIYEGGPGVFRIKLKFESLGCFNSDQDEVRFGMVDESVKDAKPSLYGWGIFQKKLEMHIRAKGGTQAGQSTSNNQDFMHGDEFELILDCDEAKLYLNYTRKGNQYYVDLPKWTKYRLCCDIPRQGCKIRVVNVCREYWI